MLIALLAVLGVDLIVILALVVFLFARKRWLKRQPGAFRGVIRVDPAEGKRRRPRWRRGYGRWVRDVLVWTRTPFLVRSELMAADGVDEHRHARPKEVKRLGDDPVVVRLNTGGATAEVAASGDDSDLLLGPYR